MSKNILYSFRRCPYAIRARLILYLCEIDYQLIEVDLKNKPQDMLEYSSKGTVPVFVVGDRVIDESLDIIDYALSIRYPKGWQVLTDEQNRLGEELITKLGTQFIPSLNRYKYADRYDDVNRDVERERIRDFAKLLDGTIEYGLVSETDSYVDVVILPLVRQAYVADPQLFDGFPKLMSWLERHLASDALKEVMSKELR